MNYASLSNLPPEMNYKQIVYVITYFYWQNKTLELEKEPKCFTDNGLMEQISGSTLAHIMDFCLWSPEPLMNILNSVLHSPKTIFTRSAQDINL